HQGIRTQIADRIRELADQSGLRWKDLRVADFSSDDLILFRTRAEVLMASQFCDVPHRLRMSARSPSLPAWLALCFFDYEDRYLAKHEFFNRWSIRVENKTS